MSAKTKILIGIALGLTAFLGMTSNVSKAENVDYSINLKFR